jgi:hypothetical protein
MKQILFFLIALLIPGMGVSQESSNEMMELTRIKTGVKSRQVSSYDRTGGNADFIGNIKDGSKFDLLNVKGAGVINRIWITIAPEAHQLSRNDIILRMYWDGSTYPSVESPLGPFFGNGWNEAYDFVTVPLSIAPGAGKSYVCYFSMPFSNGARIEIENQTGREISNFYYNIGYTEMVRLPSNLGRFHSWYNREVTEALKEGENEWAVLGKMGENKSGKDNYLFADIKGKGQFVGVNYYVNCPTPMWYGEGDEMVFIDGDTVPAFNGTGTEDFFNTSWCPKELFSHPYYGYPRVNNETGWLGRTHVYRFFITDPVYFDKSIRFTIEHGHNNNLTLDLASVAYWYQDKATPLPRSFSKEERVPKPVIGAVDIHLWRNSWRLEKNNDTGLWGNEKESK